MANYTTLSLVLVSAIVGCEEPRPAQPIELPKPAPVAMESPEEKKFEVREVVATIFLPKNHPKRSQLTGGPEDALFKSNLPLLKCHLEFDVVTEDTIKDRFSFGLGINIQEGPHRVVHASRSGEAHREIGGGKLTADIELRQTRPLEISDNATLTLQVIRAIPGTARPAKVITHVGKVILKQEE